MVVRQEDVGHENEESLRLSPIHVAFLTSGTKAPSSRYRVFQYVPHLKKFGFRCTVLNSFPEKYDYFRAMGWRMSRQLKRMVRRCHLLWLKWSRPDVVVIERELFDEPTWEFEDRLRDIARCVVLDIDDGVFLRYPEKFVHLARLCDGIIAGNSLLVDHFEKLNRHVTLIPTCVDVDKYPEHHSHSVLVDRKTIIGWIGTSSNLQQLAIVFPILKEISRRYPIVVRIISNSRDKLRELDTEGIPIEFVEWDEKTAIALLSECDIGMMPLIADDPWNHYKCGLKLIEYMALGLPAIASPVGVNAQIVTNGVDGFLASTDAEWTDAFVRLIESDERRQSIGRAARKKVLGEYSVQILAPKLAESLCRLAAIPLKQ
ncbi:MAG: glycosyltransferase family 4 protein [Planctomycetes bacterium]|nr:glycosyltransferase family 4 protein [Planctomycetota bacterium]